MEDNNELLRYLLDVLRPYDKDTKQYTATVALGDNASIVVEEPGVYLVKILSGLATDACIILTGQQNSKLCTSLVGKTGSSGGFTGFTLHGGESVRIYVGKDKLNITILAEPSAVTVRAIKQNATAIDAVVNNQD